MLSRLRAGVARHRLHFRGAAFRFSSPPTHKLWAEAHPTALRARWQPGRVDVAFISMRSNSGRVSVDYPVGDDRTGCESFDPDIKKPGKCPAFFCDAIS
jgi:hypothetical protein